MEQTNGTVFCRGLGAEWMSGVWTCSGIVMHAEGLCNVWGLKLTEGRLGGWGGGNADHAASLSPDIRYEKLVFLISTCFRQRPGLTQVLSKLPHFGASPNQPTFESKFLGYGFDVVNDDTSTLSYTAAVCLAESCLHLTFSQDVPGRSCPIYYERHTCHVRCDASITSLTAFRIHAYSASLRNILRRCQPMVV